MDDSSIWLDKALEMLRDAVRVPSFDPARIPPENARALLSHIASLERDKARWESRANRYRWALEEHYALFPTGGEKRLAFIELVGKFDDIDSELDAAMAEEGDQLV